MTEFFNNEQMQGLSIDGNPGPSGMNPDWQLQVNSTLGASQKVPFAVEQIE